MTHHNEIDAIDLLSEVEQIGSIAQVSHYDRS